MRPSKRSETFAARSGIRQKAQSRLLTLWYTLNHPMCSLLRPIAAFLKQIMHLRTIDGHCLHQTRASECDLEAVTAAVHAFVDSLSHDGEYLHHYFAPLDERAAHNEVDTGPCSRHPHHQAHLVVKTQLLELCEGHSNISPNEVLWTTRMPCTVLLLIVCIQLCR
eukprot:SAG31_NODE_349_length_17243_cov_7.408248_8_plen_165_part_00